MRNRMRVGVAGVIVSYHRPRHRHHHMVVVTSEHLTHTHTHIMTMRDYSAKLQLGIFDYPLLYYNNHDEFCLP